jgi:AraC-like DNA-binding protein/ligand-binding sensor protein
MNTPETPTIETRTDGTEESLFTRLLKEAQGDSGLHLSFEDLTGVVLDNPDIRLPYSLRIHTCDFCLHAKNNPSSHQHCVRNKMAANRLAIQRRTGFSGQCHLGLTDLVSPLVFRKHVMGVFFYGSFILEGTEAIARARIFKFCRRFGFDPESYLDALNKATRVSPSRIPELWRRLSLLTDLTRAIIENTGIPVDRYRTRAGAQFATWNGAMPSLVRTVLTFINHNYPAPLRVNDIAKTHRCNADYLSRIFRKTTGIKLVQYIQEVRVDHAKRLLQANRFSIGEVGFMVGFQDHSHFGKIFRHVVGCTPQEFRSRKDLLESEQADGTFSTFEYSNVHPFNPQFGGSPNKKGSPTTGSKMIM